MMLALCIVTIFLTGVHVCQVSVAAAAAVVSIVSVVVATTIVVVAAAAVCPCERETCLIT
jgi:hypothetical protein